MHYYHLTFNAMLYGELGGLKRGRERGGGVRDRERERIIVREREGKEYEILRLSIKQNSYFDLI